MQPPGRPTSRTCPTVGRHPLLLSQHSHGIDPSGPPRRAKGLITIGLDLGDKTSRYCLLSEEGTVLAEGSVETTKRALSQKFSGLCRCRIAIEVGTHSPWLSRLLTSLGHEVIVANARQVKLISTRSRKDDRMDAQMLARLARVDPGLLRPIRHRGEKAQMDLALIRVRAVLVNARTGLVNSERGLAKAADSRWNKGESAMVSN